MKKLRVYLDTSAIGGCFDEEFKEASNALFSYFEKELYIPIISEVAYDELEKAPTHVREKATALPSVETVAITDEMRTLAKRYVSQKIVSENYDDDALHIAIATIVNADVLVSWNFKHIVNLNKIHMFNSVNILEGYKPLEIRTPLEVIDNV